MPGMQRPRLGALRRARPLSQPGGGPPRLRQRRIQILPTLPPLINERRHSLYPAARAVHGWAAIAGSTSRLPGHARHYLARCHEAGQRRPTPADPQIQASDYNCLHQDTTRRAGVPPAGDRAAVATGRQEFTGEFMLVEAAPAPPVKGASRTAPPGDLAVVFPVNHRPVAGARGHYRVATASAGCAPARATRSASSSTMRRRSLPSGS